MRKDKSVRILREKTLFFIVTYKVEGNLGIRDTMKTKSKSTILLARLFVG